MPGLIHTQSIIPITGLGSSKVVAPLGLTLASSLGTPSIPGNVIPLANLPAGMTRIFKTTFNTLTEGGFDNFGGFTIQSDPTSPASPNNVAQNIIPAGFTPSGNATGNLERVLLNTRDIYISIWIKPSANFQGEGTSTNKICHFWVNGLNIIFLMAKGVGMVNPLRVTLGVQGVVNAPGAGTDFQNNPNIVPSASYVRGEWNYIECHWRGNDAGSNNGFMKVWRNGVFIDQYLNVTWTTAKTRFELLKLNPTWGGGGDTNGPEDIYWRFDDFEVWGAN